MARNEWTMSCQVDCLLIWHRPDLLLRWQMKMHSTSSANNESTKLAARRTLPRLGRVLAAQQCAGKWKE